jgi:hypothetical protein
MPMEVEEYVDLESRVAALGLRAPQGLAFLPRNLGDAAEQSDLLHESSVTTLRVLFRQSSIVEDCLEQPGQRIRVIQENAFELILPALFVGSLLLSSNAAAINIALNVVANYVTDFFKGIGGEKRVKFSIVIKDKTTGKYKQYKYSGDPAGVKEFTKLVERTNDGYAS